MLSKTYNPWPSSELSSQLWVRVQRASGNGMIWFLLRLGRAFQNKKQNANRKCHCCFVFARLHSGNFRIIFELIKAEQAYVKDLENIENVREIHLVLEF